MFRVVVCEKFYAVLKNITSCSSKQNILSGFGSYKIFRGLILRFFDPVGNIFDTENITACIKIQ